MKLLLFALVCLPIALAGPIEIEDRSFFGLDAHALAHLFNTTILKNDLQNLVDIVGSDASEQFCEGKCRPMMQHADHSGLLQHVCPLACRSLQSLINQLHLTLPHQQAVQTLKRDLLGNFGHGFNTDKIKEILQQTVDLFGSDPTIQLIENECHTLMKNPLLDYTCPLIAHGFQSLLQSLHIHPHPNSIGHVVNTRRARSILDTIVKTLGLNVTQLKIDAQHMLDVLGSNATESMMESYCHNRITHNQGLLDHACALVAHGMQYLIQHLHLVPDPGTPGAAGSGSGGIVG